MNADVHPHPVVYIYVLKSPDGEIRYLGKTLRPKKRLNGHLSKRRPVHLTHVYCWIRSLLRKKLKPSMEIIERCGSDWEEREVFHIARLRTAGVRLTNLANGGGGTTGVRCTEAFRRIASARMKKQIAKNPKRLANMWAASPNLHKLSNSDRDWIAMHHASGAALVDIAKPLGISPATVYRVMKKRGVMRGHSRETVKRPEVKQRKSDALRRYSDADDADFARDFASGMNRMAIAKSRKVSFSVIKSALRRRGVEVVDARIALSPEQEADVVSSYRNGISAKQLSLEFEVSEQHVYRLLSRRHLPTHYSKLNQTREHDEEIKTLYEDGVRCKEICELLKDRGIRCSAGTILVILNRMGIEAKTSKRCSVILKNGGEVIRQYRSGISPKKIAGILGTTRRNVQMFLRRSGVPTLMGHKFNSAILNNVDEVKRLYAIGATTKEVAAKIGTSTRSLNMFCRKNGIAKIVKRESADSIRLRSNERRKLRYASLRKLA